MDKKKKMHLEIILSTFFLILALPLIVLAFWLKILKWFAGVSFILFFLFACKAGWDMHKIEDGKASK